MSISSRTRSRRRSDNENDNINDNANVDGNQEQKVNSVEALNVLQQFVAAQQNTNANLVAALNAIAAGVGNQNINNNNNNNDSGYNKNKFKINATFSGKESISKWISMVKIHQARFQLSNKQIEDILYTSKDNITGDAANVVQGELLAKDGRLPLQELFDLLADTYARSRVNGLKAKLKRTKLSQFKNINEYISNVRSTLGELSLEIQSENQRNGYEIYTELTEVAKGQCLLAGLTPKLAREIGKTLQGDKKQITLNEVAQALREEATLKAQLTSIWTSKTDRDEINTLFGMEYEFQRNGVPVCRQYLAGYCKYGARCKFRHPQKSLNAGGKQFKSKPFNSNKFKNKNTFNNNKSTFNGGHPKYHANKSNGNNIQQRNAGVCFQFRDKGYCKYGENCRFKHETKQRFIRNKPRHHQINGPECDNETNNNEQIAIEDQQQVSDTEEFDDEQQCPQQ